jgi:hypothetical protein
MRFTLLFLWLALLPAYAPASSADICKPGYFAQLTQRYLPGLASQLTSRSPVAASVKRAAENKFAVSAGLNPRRLRESWIEWNELGDAQKSLLRALPKLTAEERAELIPLVRSIHPEEIAAKNFRKLILLGLYDHTSWGGLTTAIYEGNLHAHLAARYLPTIEKSLPADLRKEFLEALGDRYHSLTKEKVFRYAEVAPKRLADLYYKQLLRGDELIQLELKNGRTPREAFRAYVDRVQQYIPGDDHYSADQALAVMERVRQALREQMLKGPISNRGEEPVLWVGGSLPNGRATFIESDIDIGTNIELTAEAKAAIEKSVKDYVAVGRPDSGIHAAFKKGLDAEFWTKIHPVTFRIRAGGIDMVVVNPAGEVDIHPIR